MHKQIIRSIVIFVAGTALGLAIEDNYVGSITRGYDSISTAAQANAQAAQRTPSLQFWEYRIVTKDLRDKASDIDKELSALGGQGFEIFSMTQSSPDSGFYLNIALRRPKY